MTRRRFVRSAHKTLHRSSLRSCPSLPAITARLRFAPVRLHARSLVDRSLVAFVPLVRYCHAPKVRGIGREFILRRNLGPSRRGRLDVPSACLLPSRKRRRTRLARTVFDRDRAFRDGEDTPISRSSRPAVVVSEMRTQKRFRRELHAFSRAPCVHRRHGSALHPNGCRCLASLAPWRRLAPLGRRHCSVSVRDGAGRCLAPYHRPTSSSPQPGHALLVSVRFATPTRATRGVHGGFANPRTHARDRYANLHGPALLCPGFRLRTIVGAEPAAESSTS